MTSVCASLAVEKCSGEDDKSLEHEAPQNFASIDRSARRKAREGKRADYFKPLEEKFANEEEARNYVNSGDNVFRVDHVKHRQTSSYRRYSCRSHEACKRSYRICWRRGENGVWLEWRGQHNTKRRDGAAGEHQGVDDRLRHKLKTLWEGGSKPDEAKNVLAKQWRGTVLEDALPSIEQVRNFWKSMRRRARNAGYTTVERFRKDPAFQLPSDRSQLENVSDSQLFVLPWCPGSGAKWGVCFLCPAMIWRLQRQLNVVRTAGSAIALAADGTHEVLAHDTHALIAVGVHRLILDKEGDAAQSFAPLLFALCDSESEANYSFLFTALEYLAHEFAGESLNPGE